MQRGRVERAGSRRAGSHLARVLSAKYGQDDVAWIDYAIQEQAGVLGLNPRDILSNNR